jgi:replication initiation and membrane attachment protein
MINIIKDSINEKGLINELELKKNCKNYYSFEHNSSPKLLYKSRNSVRKDNVEVKDLKNKLIECFECTTPYDFLKAKYGGSKPTTKDINLIESLLVDQELNPGVVNVLVDYVLRTNDKKLNKNFVEAIASQWKMSNINTVKDAMLQAEKEYTKEQEKLPTWYGKDIKKEEMSNKDIEELQNMLNEFE